LEYKSVMPSHQSIPIRRTFHEFPSTLENYLKAKHHMQESYERSSNDTMKDLQWIKHSKSFDEFITSSEVMSQPFKLEAYEYFKEAICVMKLVLAS